MKSGALVQLDGSHGEGGGQILRTSLALSIITNRPLEIRNIRAGRAKPGLRRQHLTCVEAAAAMCNAELKGANVGSKHLWFTPREPTTALDLASSSLALAFDIGTAGSTTLVVQTILIPAIIAGKPLRFTVAGGTHNPMAPPFDFIARVFVPHLRAMGANVELALEKYGFVSGPPAEQRREGRRGREDKQRDRRAFYDAPTNDRGLLAVTIEPGTLKPIDVLEAPAVTERHATAIVAGLPTHVATRELEVVRERLGLSHADCEVRELSGGPANLLMIEIARGDLRELITSHGERGLRAETVAGRACDEAEAYLAADVPVGEHLADQLLLPMAVAGGGRFRCTPLSLHATTNIDTIRRFLEVPITVRTDGAASIVEIGGANGSGS
jgi:RNA 3'-terminal phosphate cyclase (ATP)